MKMKGEIHSAQSGSYLLNHSTHLNRIGHSGRISQSNLVNPYGLIFIYDELDLLSYNPSFIRTSKCGHHISSHPYSISKSLFGDAAKSFQGFTNRHFHILLIVSLGGRDKEGNILYS